MGKDLANEWNKEFIETSAKTGCNVDEAFYLLIRQTDRFRMPEIEIQSVKNTNCGSCNCL